MGSIFGAIKGMTALKGIAAMLGVSLLSLFGIMALVREAMASIFSAVEATKQFIGKIEALIKDPVLKEEFIRLKMKWDLALEVLANIAKKLGMTDWERRLRDAL